MTDEFYLEFCEHCTYSDRPGVDCGAPLLEIKNFIKVWSQIKRGHIQCPYFKQRCHPRIIKVFLVNDETGHAVQESNPHIIKAFKDIGYRVCESKEWIGIVRHG